MCTYEELSHTADLAIRVQADTREGVYACAALGMFDLIAGGERHRVPCQREEVRAVQSIDPESLLVDWLTDLLVQYEISGEYVARVEILELGEHALTARLCWGPPDFEPVEDIKAVTYHALRIEQRDDGMWVATVVFDV
nr:archease [Ardenticatena sp.]